MILMLENHNIYIYDQNGLISKIYLPSWDFVFIWGLNRGENHRPGGTLMWRNRIVKFLDTKKQGERPFGRAPQAFHLSPAFYSLQSARGGAEQVGQPG